MYKIKDTKNKGKGKDKGKGKSKDREKREEKKDEHEHQLDSMAEEDHRDSTMNDVGDGDDDIACQDREDSYSYHFTTRNPRWSYLKLELYVLLFN
jgi:hypothetical protein